MQRQKIIKALTGVFAAALLVWRCFFGLGWQDEAMHLAWVKRLYEGAVPLQEEWHVCQLSAALLIPFYALYQRVGPAFPGGAILFFRLLYMGFWILGSLYSYCLMRRVFDRGISFVIMLHILLYCRSNIFTLSYISMGPMFFLLAMLSWYVLAFHREGWPGKAVKWLGMIGGGYYALGVLCNPYGGVLFPVILGYLAYCLKKGRGREQGWFLAGILFTAAAYSSWLFSRVPVSALPELLPCILSDPEHSGSGNVLWQTCRFFGHLAYLCRYTAPAHALLAGSCLAALRRHDAGSRGRRHLFALGLLVVQCVLFFLTDGVVYIGQLVIPLCVYAVELQMIYGIADRRLLSLWGISLFYAFVSNMASNTGVPAIVMGLLPAVIPAWYGIYESGRAPGRTSLCYGTAAVFLAILLTQRVLIVNRDAPLWECTELIGTGVARGIFTSEKHREDYEQLLSDLDSLDTGRREKLYVCGMSAPFVYLCAEEEAAAPSVCPITDNAYTENYYSLNPEMLPTMILELRDDIGSWRDGGMGENSAPNASRQLPEVLRYYIEENSMEKDIFREVELLTGRAWIRDEE